MRVNVSPSGVNDSLDRCSYEFVSHPDCAETKTFVFSLTCTVYEFVCECVCAIVPTSVLHVNCISASTWHVSGDVILVVCFDIQ